MERNQRSDLTLNITSYLDSEFLEFKYRKILFEQETMMENVEVFKSVMNQYLNAPELNICNADLLVQNIK